MFVAALILLIISVLLVVAALFGGGEATSVDLGAFDLNTNATGVFFLGMATLLLLVLSLGMFRVAAKRSAARRAERRKVSELSSQLDQYRREERDSGQGAARDDT